MTPASQAAQHDVLAGLIPVSIVTGFLGSGKTTLINRLVKRPEMNRIAVIVNEVGVDDDLVHAKEDTLCCPLFAGFGMLGENSI